MSLALIIVRTTLLVAMGFGGRNQQKCCDHGWSNALSRTTWPKLRGNSRCKGASPSKPSAFQLHPSANQLA
jgi:hypothetical protein